MHTIGKRYRTICKRKVWEIYFRIFVLYLEVQCRFLTLKYSEEVIIQKLHSGESVAFREIFNTYYLPLCAYGYALVKDEDVVGDFVQEAFLNLWKRRDGFHILATIKSFLYLNVKNACLDWLKHEAVKMRNTRELSEYLLCGEDEDIILENEIHEELYRALKDLPEQSRRVVVMTMHGLSNLEIATQLNISQNTVKTLKLKAYRILRERLKNVHWYLVFLLLH